MVRLTQMARNGTVCQAGRSRMAARLRPTNTTQAISGAIGRIRCRLIRSASVTGAPRGARGAGSAGGRWTRSGVRTIFSRLSEGLT